jgi:hypothetical protein
MSEKDTNVKKISIEMSYEEAKSQCLHRKPVRLTELWRENSEENTMMIIDQESAATYKFNISALVIWKVCTGDYTVDEISQHVLESMENIGYETVLQDTLGFIITLEKLGLVGWKNE